MAAITKLLVTKKELVDLKTKMLAYCLVGEGSEKLVWQTTRPDLVVGTIVNFRLWPEGEAEG